MTDKVNDVKGEKSENNAENKKEASSFKYVTNFIYTFLITVFVIIAAALLTLKILDIDVLSVESGSMSPTYPQGSVVFVKEIAPEEINVNDVITYVLNEQGTLVTHRVTDIDSENRTFTTRGDANPQADPEPILWENVVGKVYFCIPGAAVVLKLFSDETVRPYIIAVIAAIAVLSAAGDFAEKIISKKKSQPETEENIKYEKM